MKEPELTKEQIDQKAEETLKEAEKEVFFLHVSSTNPAVIKHPADYELVGTRRE